MAIIEKRVFAHGEYSNLKTFLQEMGFIFVTVGTTERMFWGYAGQNTSCYWEIKNGGVDINFHKSNEGSDHTPVAFRSNLGFTRIEGGETVNADVGCVFMGLADHGCALYLTSLPLRTPVAELTFCCKNEYSYNPEYTSNADKWILDESKLLHNGLVIVTPAEQDNYWRYSWRSQDDRGFYWDFDNGFGVYEYAEEGHQIPHANLIPVKETCVLTKMLLQNGGWSKHIRVLTAGEIYAPGNVFRIHGQKFICFTDNSDTRCPAFRLPPEGIEANDPLSTEEYSSLKTYQVGDFCIYDGLLWKCKTKITTPEAFDDAKWEITTVNTEINSQSIYDVLTNDGSNEEG